MNSLRHSLVFHQERMRGEQSVMIYLDSERGGRKFLQKRTLVGVRPEMAHRQQILDDVKTKSAMPRADVHDHHLLVQGRVPHVTNIAQNHVGVRLGCSEAGRRYFGEIGGRRKAERKIPKSPLTNRRICVIGLLQVPELGGYEAHVLLDIVFSLESQFFRWLRI